MTQRPYTVLARFYDRLMPQVAAMNRHARRRVLGKILGSARSVCDLGCGSGETALDFASRGRRVYAVDNSPALCRLVRKKARRRKLPVRVLCKDMRRFRLPETVDLVTCEFAALNHAPRQADLLTVCRAVARALRPGGWFYFDINTPRAFAEQTPAGHWIEQRAFKLVMHGRWDARRRVCPLDFEWFLPSGRRWRHVRERVLHVAWSDAEIRRALRRTGFGGIRAWDGPAVRPPAMKSQPGFDTYYLAQKLSRR